MPSLHTAIAMLALASGLQDPEPARAPELPVRLVASVATVAPGSRFEVGVHLELPQGWHVYWENPGDTGMGTSARLTVPEGYEIEGPIYPGPARIEDPGGLVSFGYEREVVLFFRVRAPREAIGATVRLRAEVSWLICKGVCFLGEAEPELELALGREELPASAEVARLLERQRALLPQPLGDLARVEWTSAPPGSEAGPVVVLQVDAPGVERLIFFPTSASEELLAGQAFEQGKQGARLALHLRPPADADEGPPHVRGVLRLEKQALVAYYEVDLKRPADASRR